MYLIKELFGLSLWVQATQGTLRALDFLSASTSIVLFSLVVKPQRGKARSTIFSPTCQGPERLRVLCWYSQFRSHPFLYTSLLSWQWLYTWKPNHLCYSGLFKPFNDAMIDHTLAINRGLPEEWWQQAMLQANNSLLSVFCICQESLMFVLYFIRCKVFSFYLFHLIFFTTLLD